MVAQTQNNSGNIIQLWSEELAATKNDCDSYEL